MCAIPLANPPESASPTRGRFGPASPPGYAKSRSRPTPPFSHRNILPSAIPDNVPGARIAHRVGVALPHNVALPDSAVLPHNVDLLHKLTCVSPFCNLQA